MKDKHFQQPVGGWQHHFLNSVVWQTDDMPLYQTVF